MSITRTRKTTTSSKSFLKTCQKCENNALDANITLYLPIIVFMGSNSEYRCLTSWESKWLTSSKPCMFEKTMQCRITLNIIYHFKTFYFLPFLGWLFGTSCLLCSVTFCSSLLLSFSIHPTISFSSRCITFAFSPADP